MMLWKKELWLNQYVDYDPFSNKSEAFQKKERREALSSKKHSMSNEKFWEKEFEEKSSILNS